ncbi:HEAT repeat domain-containing protein [Pyxidicoccus trucidator]|uniref:HEAT repeat domain-containing protein n=1 Tax=Pyxidicoccus trucidator TaxID=2709662 RepID=UPI001F07F397|nr:HEAT repeat domain-containing protein [Pyxidicoccus trucidator]
MKGTQRVLTPGQRHRYTFDLDTRTTEDTETGRKTVHTGWGGELALTYLGSEGGHHLFQGQLVPLRVEAETEETPVVMSAEARRGLQAMFERPVYVAQDARGRVLAVHFDPAQDGPTRRFVRSLLAAMQFVAEEGAQWSTEETDTTGDFESEYLAGGSANSYTKTKRRYLRVAAPGSRTPAPVPRLKGHLAFTLFADGHVKEAAGSDVVETGGEGTGRPQVRAETRVALTSVSVDHQPLSLSDFRSVRSTLRAERLTAPMERTTSSVDGKLVDGATLDALLKLLAREPRARDSTRERLAALFRLEPSEAEHAAQRVRQGESGAALAELLVEALGNAGTPESQRALASVLEDARTRPETLANAARVAARQERPTVELAEALDRVVEETPILEVRNLAAQAMGSLVKELEPREPGRSRALLEGMLGRCQSRRVELVVCLKTLANAGSQRGLAYARSALLHPAPMVRGTATEALRSIPGAEADALLDQVLLGDPSPRVRTQAVAAISQRVSGPHLRAMATALRADSSEQVRMEVVRALGSWKAVDEVATALLRDVADNDTSERVRRLATSMLAR